MHDGGAVFGIAEDGKAVHSIETQRETVRTVVHVENEKKASALRKTAEKNLKRTAEQVFRLL